MCNLLPFIDWRLLLQREMGFFYSHEIFHTYFDLFMSVAVNAGIHNYGSFAADVKTHSIFFPFYCKPPQVQMTRKFVDEFGQLWELEEFRKFDSVSGDFKATRS